MIVHPFSAYVHVFADDADISDGSDGKERVPVCVCSVGNHNGGDNTTRQSFPISSPKSTVFEDFSSSPSLVHSLRKEVSYYAEHQLLSAHHHIHRILFYIYTHRSVSLSSVLVTFQSISAMNVLATSARTASARAPPSSSSPPPDGKIGARSSVTNTGMPHFLAIFAATFSAPSSPPSSRERAGSTSNRVGTATTT